MKCGFVFSQCIRGWVLCKIVFLELFTILQHWSYIKNIPGIMFWTTHTFLSNPSIVSRDFFSLHYSSSCDTLSFCDATRKCFPHLMISCKSYSFLGATIHQSFPTATWGSTVDDLSIFLLFLSQFCSNGQGERGLGWVCLCTSGSKAMRFFQ